MVDICVSYSLDPLRQVTPREMVSLDCEGHVSMFTSGSALLVMCITLLRILDMSGC